MVVSQLPDNAVLPSGENATEVTPEEWPSKDLMTRPVDKSHHLTVLSFEPDNAVLPSGENATAITSPKDGRVRT